ncbi:hypothetical protein [Halostreptopolyspora alba]|uniref:AbiEi antitoxin C-terminal domain-containing protein n=1 Tax=Halostreptopolyspora alba TaxID=2487137 RepID=A0A3N0E3X0_9ACTN|nr:hypothetical protein EFW17_18785 [Nocardiopsaceae bacterium YIM 96095]
MFLTRLPCTGDDAVALFAAYQFGLVSHAQACRSGLGRAAVEARLRAGKWVPTPHSGVFRVAGFGASAWFRHVMAAILAVAPGAFACHETAARLWRLDGPPWGGEDVVHVGVRSRSTVPPWPRVGSGRARVRVHVLPVGDDELTCRPPFLVTSVRRTLDDLGRRTDRATFARVRDSAVRQRLVPSAAPVSRGRPPPHGRVGSALPSGGTGSRPGAGRRTPRARGGGSGTGACAALLRVSHGGRWVGGDCEGARCARTSRG